MNRRQALLLLATVAWYLLISPWMTEAGYLSMQDELFIRSTRFSWIVAPLYLLCAIGQLGVPISSRVPQGAVRVGLFFSFTAGGALMAMGLGAELAWLLLGAFLGMLAGGLAAVLLDWDDVEASRILVIVYLGVIGLTAWFALLGWLTEVWPAVEAALDLFFGRVVMIAGGVLGMALGFLCTLWFGERSDRFLKDTLATLGAAISFRVAVLAAGSLLLSAP